MSHWVPAFIDHPIMPPLIYGSLKKNLPYVSVMPHRSCSSPLTFFFNYYYSHRPCIDAADVDVVVRHDVLCKSRRAREEGGLHGERDWQLMLSPAVTPRVGGALA